MDWLRVALLGACSGCVAVMPPPAHYIPLGPVSAQAPRRPAVELGAALGFPPQVGATYSRPFEGAPALVGDVSGQLGFTSALAAAGVTLRTRPEEHAGGHVGVRLGAIGGVGDLRGRSRFGLPFAGGEGDLQVAWGWGQRAGAFTVNLGFQATVPITDREFTFEDLRGDTITDTPLAGIYGTLDSRVDLPLNEDVAVVLGGGFDFPYFIGILPRAAAAVRWTPAVERDVPRRGRGRPRPPPRR